MYNKETILRYTIALMFVAFGALKFFPHLSPAEIIGSQTVCKLTFGLFSEENCLLALAILELSIGLILIPERFIRFAIPLAIFHLAMTFTPFWIFPSEVFDPNVSSLSLLGQYIIKNIIIIGALFVLYPTKENNQTYYNLIIKK